MAIRDRLFILQGGGYGFFSFRIFFFRQHKSQNIYFFCRAKREFFFLNLTLGYMTKTLNHIFFFPPPKSEYFFQQHWESEYYFQKKNHNPTFKLNGPSLRILLAKFGYIGLVISKEMWTVDFSIFRNRGHIKRLTHLSDIISKEDQPRILLAKFGQISLSGLRGDVKVRNFTDR